MICKAPNLAKPLARPPVEVTLVHMNYLTLLLLFPAVTVAASCAFPTPIGHKNSTLIMGFGSYWHMGLALEIIVIVVSIPMILWVWLF